MGKRLRKEEFMKKNMEEAVKHAVCKECGAEESRPCVSPETGRTLLHTHNDRVASYDSSVLPGKLGLTSELWGEIVSKVNLWAVKSSSRWGRKCFSSKMSRQTEAAWRYLVCWAIGGADISCFLDSNRDTPMLQELFHRFLAALHYMRPYEKIALELRYGISDEKTRTFNEVGKILGVGVNRARQLVVGARVHLCYGILYRKEISYLARLCYLDKVLGIFVEPT